MIWISGLPCYAVATKCWTHVVFQAWVICSSLTCVMPRCMEFSVRGKSDSTNRDLCVCKGDAKRAWARTSCSARLKDICRCIICSGSKPASCVSQGEDQARTHHERFVYVNCAKTENGNSSKSVMLTLLLWEKQVVTVHKDRVGRFLFYCNLWRGHGCLVNCLPTS